MPDKIMERETILLAEKESKDSLARRSALENNGYYVITADTVDKIPGAADRSNVSLVLMDVDFGGRRNGYEAGIKISPAGEIPVVFLHASGEFTDNGTIPPYGFIPGSESGELFISYVRNVLELSDVRRKLKTAEIKKYSSYEDDFAALIAERDKLIYDSESLKRDIIRVSDMERRCIDQEIHDGLGQLLTGMTMMLRTMKKAEGMSPDDMAAKLDEISRITAQAMRFCGRLTDSLRIKNIARDQLLSAIHHLIRDIRDAFNIDCCFRNHGRVNLDSDFVSTQIYRIIHDVLNKAARHGRAVRIDVGINWDSGVDLSIRCDGYGLDSSPDEYDTCISVIKCRAELLGARFRSETGKKGFLLSVYIPSHSIDRSDKP